MDHAGLPSALVFDLKNESPFSFKCQVCSACCYNKTIPVAPYEVLRLARNLGLSTTEFIRTCTEEGQIVLRNQPDGGCIFLAPRGCGVYPHRPLVCRLFPLGQLASREGDEKYGAMPLHPDCLGQFGEDGTVKAYLDSQGVGPYFHYDKVYRALYEKMLERLKKGENPAEAILVPTGARPFHPDVRPRQGILLTWIDIDEAVAALRRNSPRNEPRDLEEAVSFHLEAIKGWLASF